MLQHCLASIAKTQAKGIRSAKHTQHRGHDGHARVLLVLVGSTDTQVVDGVQPDGVEAGGNVLGRHVEGKLDKLSKSSSLSECRWLFVDSDRRS